MSTTTTPASLRHRLGAAALTLATTLGLAAAPLAAFTPTADALTGGAPIAESDNPTLRAAGPGSLRINLGTSVCSATLLNDGWVLTAEHCFDSVNLTDPDGNNAIHGATASGVDVSAGVRYAVTWPAYDVALLRTTHDLTWDLGPGTTIAETTPTLGETVWARGYGNDYHNTDPRQMPATIAGDHVNKTLGDALIWRVTTPSDYIRAGDSGSALLNERGEAVSVLGFATDIYDHPDGGALAWTTGAGTDLSRFPQLNQALRDFDDARSAEEALAINDQNAGGVSTARHIRAHATGERLVVAMGPRTDGAPLRELPVHNNTSSDYWGVRMTEMANLSSGYSLGSSR